MLPEVRPVADAVTVAEVVVVVEDAVGLLKQVSAPDESVVPDEAKQKVIVVDAPFAVTEPLSVADVAPIEEGAEVLATGRPAPIVRVRVLTGVDV